MNETMGMYYASRAFISEHENYELKNKIKRLEQNNINLQNRINKAIELKHNWQKEQKNSMMIFENNSLINFMNKLENILKGDDEN